LPLIYDGEKLDLGYRVDLLVEHQAVVEIKCVEAIPPVHHAQPLSYMRLSGKSPGLLINFYLAHLRMAFNGCRRKELATIKWLSSVTLCVFCG